MTPPRLIFAHYDTLGSIEIWSDKRFRLIGVYAYAVFALPLGIGTLAAIAARSHLGLQAPLALIALACFAFVMALLFDASRR